MCSKVFSNIEKITGDLQANIKRYRQQSKKKRKFENFASPVFGSENDRKQLVDAMEDMISPVEPKYVKIEFPKNNYAKIAEDTLSEILRHGNTHPYALLHEGVSENIQTDILEWLQKTQATIEKENPFFDEAIFLAQQKKLSAQEIALDLSAENSKIQYHYKRLPSVSDSKRGSIAPSTLDFDFYRKSFSEQKKIKPDKDGKETIAWKSAEKLDVLCRNFLSDMEKNLIDRKNKWEMERIDALRKQFLEELYKKIEKFMRLEKLLSPFIKDLGRLWDLSNKAFETSGFEILEQFAKLLEQDESLQELAKMIGKQSRTQEIFEKEMRDKIVIKTEWHPKPAYRGEINGLRYSSDIASVLPAELAMMKNPAAKKLFQLKFAQKQLLSFDYQNDKAESKEEHESEEVDVAKKDQKGPVIICVDTSGSMQGTPENIAKTVTFALSKIAMEEERKCYLISFSTGIETLDMSDFKSGDALTRIVQFLRMSFNGGTDASPALKHAVQMLQKDGYKNADVLMISDFVMGTLPDDLVKSIEEEKKKNTDFYSLVIGSSGNQSTIACFNHNWLYDTSDSRAQRHLVEHLQTMRTRT
ncbi:VWA domain-containing protein [Treponema saccharophilum]|uniref:VWA domain-containing protein n=1 Tax=Treponema saccharophilum TaxID=165 RepID=UPI00030FECAB